MTIHLYGGLAEWSKAADLRSVGRLSARVRTSHPSVFFFYFDGATKFLKYGKDNVLCSLRDSSPDSAKRKTRSRNNLLDFC